ncbi:MAG: hypothetical protein M3O90_11365 [Actinomycetota bacterium]|nr:hypothetical protein [Actinomycetota bacterium]
MLHSVITMTALAAGTGTRTKLTRRQRAGRTIAAALRGGLLGGAVAGCAWLLATVIAGTAVLVLVLATVAAAGYTVLRGTSKPVLWAALAAAWAVVLIERWAVNGHGGLWVAAAAWLGVILSARRAGISRWSLPLLAYPLVCVAIAVAEHQSLLSPWGTSWLWVGAVLGPVLGARTLLKPNPSVKPDPAPARAPRP